MSFNIIINIITILSFFASITIFLNLCGQLCKKNNSTLLSLVTSLLFTLALFLEPYISNEPLFFIVLFTFYSILLFLFLKKSFAITIFFSCFFTFHLILSKTFSFSVFSIILKRNIYEIILNPSTLYLSLLLSSLLLLITIVIYKLIVPIKSISLLLNHNPLLTNTILIHILLTIFMLFNSYSFYLNLDFIWLSLSQILICFIIYSIYLMILRFSIKVISVLQVDIKSKSEISKLNTQLTLYKFHQKSIDNDEKIKRLYTEMNETVEYLLENRDIDNTLIELKNKNALIMPLFHSLKKYSNNTLLNSLLFEFEESCINSNIEFTSTLYIPDNLPFSENILSKIFQNLLDNSFEACNNINDNLKKFIKIESKLQNNWLSIKLSNPFSNKIILKNNLPISIKNSNFEGYSLQQIKNIIESKNGSIQFKIDHDNSIFNVIIFISLNN